MTVRTYQLKQQTPMIHFQSNETGATLRASEVKPKLDRFLLAQHGGADNVRTSHPDWFMSKHHASLKYKLRFEAKGIPDIKDPHKLYFGNMGIHDANAMRKTVYYPDGVEMTVICFYSNLQSEIEKYISCFFALHAFGTRSGKGFGCFSVLGAELNADLLAECCPHKTYYAVTYPVNPSTMALLNDVWVIRGMMKSGFNFTFQNPKDYYKGHIFRYFTTKGIGGDKAFIKQKVLISGTDSNVNSEERKAYSDFRFVRAMLGLPGGFEFRSGSKTTRRGKVDVQSKDVERFQSPILYRLYSNQLLLIPQKIPQEMLDATFNLNTQSIRTPKEFNLIDFLDSFCTRFNARTEISAFQSPNVKNSLISNSTLKIEKKGGGTI